jgi:hypothetical protein
LLCTDKNKNIAAISEQWVLLNLADLQSQPHFVYSKQTTYISCRVFLVHTWSVDETPPGCLTFRDGSLELAWKVYGWSTRRVRHAESSDVYMPRRIIFCCIHAAQPRGALRMYKYSST